MTTILLKNQVYSLGKLNSEELYNILILGNCKKTMSQGYSEVFFESPSIDWKDIYLLPRKTCINIKPHPSQNKILNNVLYLNNFFSNLEKLNLGFVRSVSQQRKQLFI